MTIITAINPLKIGKKILTENKSQTFYPGKPFSRKRQRNLTKSGKNTDFSRRSMKILEAAFRRHDGKSYPQETPSIPGKGKSAGRS